MAKKINRKPSKDLYLPPSWEQMYVRRETLKGIYRWQLKLSQGMPHRSFYLHFRLPEIIYLPPSENIPLSYDITGVFRPCLLRLLCIG